MNFSTALQREQRNEGRGAVERTAKTKYGSLTQSVLHLQEHVQDQKLR